MTDLLRDWLRDMRTQHAFRQVDVTERTAALHGRVTQATISQLETGQLRLTDLTAAQQEALRQVLDITPAEWAAHVNGVLESRDEVALRLRGPRRRQRPQDGKGT